MKQVTVETPTAVETFSAESYGIDQGDLRIVTADDIEVARFAAGQWQFVRVDDVDEEGNA